MNLGNAAHRLTTLLDERLEGTPYWTFVCREPLNMSNPLVGSNLLRDELYDVPDTEMLTFWLHVTTSVTYESLAGVWRGTWENWLLWLRLSYVREGYRVELRRWEENKNTPLTYPSAAELLTHLSGLALLPAREVWPCS